MTNKGEWDRTRKDNYIVNFKGRKYNKCTPTDLDWVLEIKNKVLIFAEVKRSERGGDLPIGQRILAENLCNYIDIKVIPVYFLHVEGLVINSEIKIEDSKVLKYYSNLNKTWKQTNIIFNEAVNLILKKHLNYGKE